MEDQDDGIPQDEQAIRDQIDDEIDNRDLLEREPPQIVITEGIDGRARVNIAA